MELRSLSRSLVMSLDVVLLLSNTAWQHATPIVSFTCVGIDYAESAEDWRQVEDFFGRIRNCGESGGHMKSDACSMYTFNPLQANLNFMRKRLFKMAA